MISASGNTRQILASVHAKLDSTAMGEAESLLTGLIASASIEELAIVAPDLREAIDRFFPKRKRNLLGLLETRLSRSTPKKIKVQALDSQ